MDFQSIMNIFGTLGGSVVVIVGLSRWFGKILATKLIEKDKAIYSQELEKLKNQLKSKEVQTEHFHQISEKTYQDLFDKKIQTYTSLLNAKTQYQKTLKEDGMFELMECPCEIYYDFFNQIRNIIDNNRLHISNELSDKYNELYFKIAPLIKKLEIAQEHIRANNISSNHKKENIYSDMVLDTSNELDELLKQIDTDVENLRKKLQTIF